MCGPQCCRTCTMKEYVSRFSDSFCCIVCGCVRVTAPNYIHKKTFNGPLHVYIPNTHAHERSLREVNMIVLVKHDFFMGWSSIVFKLDEKWWNFDRLWSICGHRLTTWRLTELSRKNIRFWSEFGSIFNPTPCTGDKNRVDFENRYFYPQGGYGRTLLVFGQTYNKNQILF